MPANVYLNSISLTAGVGWTRLAPVRTVLTGTLVLMATQAVMGASNIDIRFRGGSAVLCPSTATIQFESVDLYEIEVKYSNTNTTVFVFGYTR